MKITQFSLCGEKKLAGPVVVVVRRLLREKSIFFFFFLHFLEHQSVAASFGESEW